MWGDVDKAAHVHTPFTLPGKLQQGSSDSGVERERVRSRATCVKQPAVLSVNVAEQEIQVLPYASDCLLYAESIDWNDLHGYHAKRP